MWDDPSLAPSCPSLLEVKKSWNGWVSRYSRQMPVYPLRDFLSLVWRVMDVRKAGYEARIYVQCTIALSLMM